MLMKELKIVLKPDYEGEVVATLLHSNSTTGSIKGAILYIHGYIDYFFQSHVAKFFNSHGYDFYALDLRKYGRSLLPNQHFNYCRDLTEYFEEITSSINIITSDGGHKSITLLAHSTGGLTSVLYAAKGELRDKLNMLILNSPFFELNANWLKRNLFVPISAYVSNILPYAKKKNELSLYYFDSIYKGKMGEWDFNTSYKPREGVPLYFAWLKSIWRGQLELKRGLNLAIPVFVITSDKSSNPKKWCKLATVSDTVLNIKSIEKNSAKIGSRVVYHQIPDALHDIFLSKESVREEAFDYCLKILNGDIKA